MIPRKVLIYAIHNDRLLVFDEPDFPDVPIQVPGGTVDDGESIEVAARREFIEETGIAPSLSLRHLETLDQSFQWKGTTFTHRRSYFHLALDPGLPESWDHYEETPSGGGEPVLFRFFWLSLEEAARRLGLGMGECLDQIEG
jgi:8-oxo-dGTP pyrophosphatase MutT (NUDIX family)